MSEVTQWDRSSLPQSPVMHTVDVPLEGTWKLTVKGPTGPVSTLLVIEDKDGELSGVQSGQPALPRHTLNRQSAESH
jgi:hypothetical protein